MAHIRSGRKAPAGEPASVEEAWESLILASHVLETALERHSQRVANVSHGQFKILVLLAGSPDHTSGLKDIADTLRYSLSRLSHAVVTLERRGLVERAPIPGGRRSQRATLTAEGRRIVARVLRDQRATLRDPLLGALSGDDRSALQRITRELLDRTAVE